MELDLTPPDAETAQALTAAMLGVVAPDGGPTALQLDWFGAITHSMTGHAVDTRSVAITGTDALAELLARRNHEFRSRIANLLLVGELLLPADRQAEVCARVDAALRAIDVAPELALGAREVAPASLGLAVLDFARHGYEATWEPGHFPLHTTEAVEQAWARRSHDDALAARWTALGELPADTLGSAVHRFYRHRGFTFPGTPDSAPPLLAQHDWVHVVAEYGATIDNELEVFGFIARSSPNPIGFSLFAMVVALFETGALTDGAGSFFTADAGHLSRPGMATRVADAFRRGAHCGTDLFELDWFDLADRPIEVVRAELHVPPKDAAAIDAGSTSPWEAGGFTSFQLDAGRRIADELGVPYEPFGASTR
jgi:hypothetical protein